MADAIRVGICGRCLHTVLGLYDAAGELLEQIAHPAVAQCRCPGVRRVSLRRAALTLLCQAATDSRSAAAQLHGCFSADSEQPSPSGTPTGGRR